MIRLKEKISSLLPLVVAWMVSLPAPAQDYYGPENSARFAEHLFRTGQYDLAAQEYERVVFLRPGHQDARLRLIQSYRLGQQYEKGLGAVTRMYTDSLDWMPAGFAREYLKTLLLAGELDRAGIFCGSARFLDEREKQDYLLSVILLGKEWDKAGEFNRLHPTGNARLTSLVMESADLRYRKAGVALALSTVVPGAGKVYTRQWKDGLISFLFVTANAYQAYRGFSKKGTDSVHGWVFGGLAVGFYGGNLFGSFKSARVYNRGIDEKLHRKAENIILGGF